MNDAALIERIATLSRQGRKAEARAALAEASATGGIDDARLVETCRGLVAAGARNFAREVILDLTGRHPGFAPALALLGEILALENDLAGSLDAYAAALEADPGRAEVSLATARTLAFAGRFGEALRHFHTALVAEPGNEAARRGFDDIAARFESRPNNYFWAMREICARRPPDGGAILELGSRDALDAIQIGRLFPKSPVVAFEANPESARICERNIAFARARNVALIDKAVSDVDGTVEFFPFDADKYDNVGSSSMMKIDFVTTRTEGEADYDRENPQYRITVESLRLDTFLRDRGIARVDLVLMDLQGAELLALRGMGDRLSEVSHIVSEASLRSTYVGGCSFDDLDRYLRGFGFKAISPVPEDDGTFREFNVIWERAERPSA